LTVVKRLPMLGDMNTKEIEAEVRRLADERGWAEGSPQEVYLLELLSAREEARSRIRSQGRLLKQDLDRLDKILTFASPLLNELGELQNRPSAVEAMVGQFIAADRLFRRYLEVFPAVAGS
jgi:hypothetical protein